MDKSKLLEMLYAVKNGEIVPEIVAEKLKTAPFEDLGFAKVDHHRGLRQGVAEVIFGQNKTAPQIIGIAESMIKNDGKNILITRLSKDMADEVAKTHDMEYHEIPSIGVINRSVEKDQRGLVSVVSGGTSDMPVAEEAAITAEVLGSQVTRIYDAGVAGIHRLLAHVDVLSKSRVVVAVAGMEGALASVVGGLVACPVIAVPTSVGYGANFGGVSALLCMLNSCASGVSVVNIDNGFGAGYMAHIINTMEGVN